MAQATSNDIGPEPDLAWIELDLLIIDHNYQRDAIPTHVQNILLNFNWRYFQPPSVCSDDHGKYWVIDGQQRVLAAELHPAINKVPCYVINTPLTKDQAAAFIRVNKDRRNVNQVNMYWAGIAAEDEKYLAVQRVVHSARAEVSQHLGLLKAKTTNAVGCILLCVRTCGEQNTGLAVKVLREAHPETPNALSSNFIRALSTLFRDYEGISEGRMVALLAGINLDALNANALLTRRTAGGSTVALLSKEIMARYLKQRKAA